MEKTVKEIADYVNGVVCGDDQVRITGFSGLKEAKPGDLSFLGNSKYAGLLNDTKASAVLVAVNDKYQSRAALIKVQNPSLAFSRILSLFVPGPTDSFKGIHETAVIAPTVKMGKNVTVGPHVVMEDDVELQDGSIIGAGSFIGFNTRIGKETLIYPNVSIMHQTIIGDRVIIHSGTVIGSDGFGFATEEGSHEKIPQIGIVEIGNNVEIGANVAIDRARFDRTVIGEGTKIDNFVQIAHNVHIGKKCLIVAHAGIAGSAVIEDGVVVGGQVGIAGHITVGAGTMIAAQSGITNSVEPKSILFGTPARPHMQEKRIQAVIKKLPEHVKLIKDLQQKVDQLEKKISENS